MNLHHFRHLFDYSTWASLRLLDSCAQLTDEQWTRDLSSSFPSVRDTFAHLLGAEWLWLRRWQGRNPTERPAWSAAPSVEDLRRVLHEIDAERAELVARCTEDDVARVIHFNFLSGQPGSQRLGATMMHAANHSTYHRGQVVTMLRQMGVAPPSTDLFGYDQQTGAGS